MYEDPNNNDGEYCKSTSISKRKRYAGTKEWNCFGGDNYNKNRNSTDCSNKCPGNTDEICGDRNLIIIYDTWMCITSPCQNGATCNDINADTFTCHCTEGWTGHLCNETPTPTISHTTNSSYSFPFTWLSTTSVSTTTTTGDDISTITTTNLTTIFSSTTLTATSEITKTNATVSANNTKLNSSAPTSKSLLAVYISAPTGVVIAAIGVITFLIIRKMRSRKKDDSNAIYNKSDEATHTCSFSNTAYIDHDAKSDIAFCPNVSDENKANDKLFYNIEESDYQYETTNPDINNEIHVDENGYGHLKSETPAVLYDSTYSHTTNLHDTCNNTRDNKYSNVDTIRKKLQSEVILNDADGTYSHINRPAGKLKLGVYMNFTDNTYSKLNNNGIKMNKRDRIDNHTGMGQNEPEYDHT